MHAVAGNGRAVVNWAAAASNGSPITGYTVTASPGGARVLVSAANTTATVQGSAYVESKMANATFWIDPIGQVHPFR